MSIFERELRVQLGAFDASLLIFFIWIFNELKSNHNVPRIMDQCAQRNQTMCICHREIQQLTALFQHLWPIYNCFFLSTLSYACVVCDVQKNWRIAQWIVGNTKRIAKKNKRKWVCRKFCIPKKQKHKSNKWTQTLCIHPTL